MKISITIDLNKLDKSKITEREFTTKDGQTVKLKEYKLDVVDLKEPKIIKEGTGWVMKKTHFVAEPQTKEEIANKKPTVYLGDGISFESTRDGGQNEQSIDDIII